MFRNPLFLVFGAALLSAGCVPVTEPLGDISKAEPDKNLLGAWAGETGLTITVPEVKGHPKGLMRAVSRQEGQDPASALWFFTTTIGKHSYANIILAPGGGLDGVQFDKDGAFAQWQKGSKKRYFIFRYKLDGDKLVVDGGNDKVFANLMKTEKFGQVDSNFFETPAGWLTKYLGKNDPDTIYDQSNANKYTRAKKK
jgi:hypothetical protein